MKDSNPSSVGETLDNRQKEHTQETSTGKTETLVIDGISIKLNYSDKKNDHVLDHIKKPWCIHETLAKKRIEKFSALRTQRAPNGFTGPT